MFDGTAADVQALVDGAEDSFTDSFDNFNGFVEKPNNCPKSTSLASDITETRINIKSARAARDDANYVATSDKKTRMSLFGETD